MVDFPHVNPPFNTAQVRFKNAGYHSAFRYDVPGPIGPGEYDVTGLPNIRNIIDWSQKVKLEMFAKNLGFFNNKILEERKFLAASGGPGVYDVPKVGIDAGKSQGIKENIGFGGIGPRFRKKYKNDCPPPPGTYDIKDTIIPAKERKKMRIAPRFPKPKATASVGPGVYKYNLPGSVDYLLNRHVSSKGPYKTFTGPRDDRTMFGYLKKQQTLTRDIVLPDPKSAMQIVFDPHRQNCGKWYPGNRFDNAAKIRIMLNDPEMRNVGPNEPGPDHYFKTTVTTIKRCKYPFNNSNELARPGITRDDIPGVGRYESVNSKLIKIPGNGHRYIFQTKSKRGWQPRPTYNAF